MTTEARVTSCKHCEAGFERRASGRRQDFCPGGKCRRAHDAEARRLGRQVLARRSRKKSEKLNQTQTAVADQLRPLADARRVARRLIAAGHEVQFVLRVVVDGRAKTIDQGAGMAVKQSVFQERIRENIEEFAGSRTAVRLLS